MVGRSPFIDTQDAFLTRNIWGSIEKHTRPAERAPRHVHQMRRVKLDEHRKEVEKLGGDERLERYRHFET